MKNLFIAIFILLYVSASGVTLFYKKNKILTIDQCNASGSKLVDNEDFNTDEYIYFSFSSKDGWKIKRKDYEKKFPKIILVQNNKKFNVSNIESLNEGKNTNEIIMQYNKQEINIYEPFYFQYENNKSDEFQISELLWSNYNLYAPVFFEAEDFFNNKQYIKAHLSIEQIVNINDENINKFSFYNDALIIYNNSVNLYLKKINGEYKIIDIQLNRIDFDVLDSLRAFYKKFYQNFLKINYYFDNNNPYSEFKNLKEDFNETISTIINSLSDYNENCSIHELSFFNNYDYSNYKFALFLEILTKQIIFKEDISPVTSIDSINVSLLDQFTIEKNELKDLNWLEEFEHKVFFINQNLNQKSMLFDNRTFKNLKRHQEDEREPYYDILWGFNHLALGNLDSLNYYIKQSYKKCTNKDWLDQLQFWESSVIAAKKWIPDKTINILNEGLANLRDREFDSAYTNLNIANSSITNFAPACFYFGQIVNQMDNLIRANIYFDRALEINPDYIKPRLFKIDRYYYNLKFENALYEVNQALEYADYWIYNYYKALILYKQNNYQSSQELINNKCIQINKSNFDQYILLGDIYKALNDNTKAKEYYYKAGDLNPRSDVYINRIDNLPSN